MKALGETTTSNTSHIAVNHSPPTDRDEDTAFIVRDVLDGLIQRVEENAGLEIPLEVAYFNIADSTNTQDGSTEAALAIHKMIIHDQILNKQESSEIIVKVASFVEDANEFIKRVEDELSMWDNHLETGEGATNNKIDSYIQNCEMLLDPLKEIKKSLPIARLNNQIYLDNKEVINKAQSILAKTIDMINSKLAQLEQQLGSSHGFSEGVLLSKSQISLQGELDHIEIQMSHKKNQLQKMNARLCVVNSSEGSGGGCKGDEEVMNLSELTNSIYGVEVDIAALEKRQSAIFRKLTEGDTAHIESVGILPLNTFLSVGAQKFIKGRANHLKLIEDLFQQGDRTLNESSKDSFPKDLANVIGFFKAILEPLEGFKKEMESCISQPNISEEDRLKIKITIPLVDPLQEMLNNKLTLLYKYVAPKEPLLKSQPLLSDDVESFIEKGNDLESIINSEIEKRDRDIQLDNTPAEFHAKLSDYISFCKRMHQQIKKSEDEWPDVSSTSDKIKIGRAVLDKLLTKLKDKIVLLEEFGALEIPAPETSLLQTHGSLQVELDSIDEELGSYRGTLEHYRELFEEQTNTTRGGGGGKKDEVNSSELVNSINKIKTRIATLEKRQSSIFKQLFEEPQKLSLEDATD